MAAALTRADAARTGVRHMEPPSLWIQILLGIVALLIFVTFLPGARAALERSRQAQHRDWRGFLVPIVLVVAFVLFLISMVR